MGAFIIVLIVAFHLENAVVVVLSEWWPLCGCETDDNPATLSPSAIDFWWRMKRSLWLLFGANILWIVPWLDEPTWLDYYAEAR